VANLIYPILFLLTCLFPLQSAAIDVALDKGESIEIPRSGWIPYLFSTDSLGTAVGAGYFTAGKNQPQSGILGTGYVTSNDSYLAMVAITNHKLSDNSRFFYNIFAMVSHFSDERFYVDLAPDLTQPNFGSNESTKEGFVTRASDNIQFEFTLKYPLAMGNAKNDPVSIFYLDEGLLYSGPQGGKEYDPGTSGKTILEATLFHKYRDLEERSEPELRSVNSNGIKFVVDHNNTDFTRNPTFGSRQKLTLTRDYGWLNQSSSWTNTELELTKYINLKKSKGVRQKVLALNFWTSNTASWEVDPVTEDISHRPPPGIGSSLGGYDRMRAYPSARFHDKAAVYYSAEFRLIPEANPFRDLSLFSYFDIDWMQIVGFVEAGRVSSNYNSDLFRHDLKVDGGISLRLMTYHAVVRLDWATSNEGNSIWAMYEQTFGR